jgi:hypothetical protein
MKNRFLLLVAMFFWIILLFGVHGGNTTTKIVEIKSKV